MCLGVRGFVLSCACVACVCVRVPMSLWVCDRVLAFVWVCVCLRVVCL